MTTYREIELRNIINEFGAITITVVNDNDETFDETFTNIDEAIQAINSYENDREVYF